MCRARANSGYRSASGKDSNVAWLSYAGVNMGGTMASTEDNVERAARFIVTPVAVIFGLWLLAITWTAFVGGQAPLFPYEFTNVNIIRGLLWLMVIDPILLTVGYWVLLIIALPIVGLVAGASSLSQRESSRRGAVPSSPVSQQSTAGVAAQVHPSTAVMPARIGALHLWQESETGPGELVLAPDGQAVFRVTHGPQWNLGNLRETITDYRINEEGRVVVGFKPPLSIMMWAETSDVPALLDLLESSNIPQLGEGDLPPTS